MTYGLVENSSVVLLRLDINICKSAVLCLVGANGIGAALDSAMNKLYWDQAGLILALIFTVVILTEIVASTIRSCILWVHGAGLVSYKLFL